MKSFFLEKTRISLIKNKDAKNITINYYFLALLNTTIFSFSSLFIFLFVIDKVGLQKAVTLLIINLVLKSSTDFLTGNLADSWSYRKVLVLSYVFFSLGYAMIAFAQSFDILIIAYILLGLGDAQASGALYSWYSNVYNVLMVEEDPKRDIYSIIQGKIIPIIRIFGVLMIITGGFLSAKFTDGRQLVIAGQSVLMILLMFIINNFMTDHSKNNTSKPSYLSGLRESLKLSVNDKKIRYTIIANVLWNVQAYNWIKLILPFTYIAYSNSDLTASFVRGIILSIGLFYSWKIVERLSKLNPRRWYFISGFGSSFSRFIGTAVIFIIYPFSIGTYSFNSAAILWIIIFQAIASVFDLMAGQIGSKISLRAIPNDHRNAISSLSPTIATILSIFSIYVFSVIIDIYGFVPVMISLFIAGVFATLSKYISIVELEKYEIALSV